jgi:hypothetical protein
VERETAELPFVDTWMNFSGPIEGRARVDVPDWSNCHVPNFQDLFKFSDCPR